MPGARPQTGEQERDLGPKEGFDGHTSTCVLGEGSRSASISSPEALAETARCTSSRRVECRERELDRGSEGATWAPRGFRGIRTRALCLEALFGPRERLLSARLSSRSQHSTRLDEVHLAVLAGASGEDVECEVDPSSKKKKQEEEVEE